MNFSTIERNFTSQYQDFAAKVIFFVNENAFWYMCDEDIWIRVFVMKTKVQAFVGSQIQLIVTSMWLISAALGQLSSPFRSLQ